MKQRKAVAAAAPASEPQVEGGAESSIDRPVHVRTSEAPSAVDEAREIVNDLAGS
jgi:hypothetical protein